MRAYLSRLIWGSPSTRSTYYHSTAMVAAKELVENTIKENKVTIFSKSWCPYCAKAKSLLKTYPGVQEAEVKILELDEMGTEGSDIQAYLAEKTGQRTVPNIFINQQHVGGSDDLAKAEKNGKLKELIAA